MIIKIDYALWENGYEYKKGHWMDDREGRKITLAHDEITAWKVELMTLVLIDTPVFIILNFILRLY